MTDRPYPCPHCPRGFETEAGLTFHMQRKHIEPTEGPDADMHAFFRKRFAPAEKVAAQDEREKEFKAAMFSAWKEPDALQVEVERLKSENARLIEDRARFPDKPDDIGNMIGAHFRNLKAGQESAEQYARKWGDKVFSLEAENQRLREEVERLNKEADENTAEWGAVRLELAEVKADSARLMEERDSYQRVGIKAMEERNALKDDARRLIEAEDSFGKRVTELEAELAEAIEWLEHFSSKAAVAERRNSEGVVTDTLSAFLARHGDKS